MTGDPDAIGEDGYVRLRRYLRIADTDWFAAGCTGCGRQRDIRVKEAIAAMGSGEATVGELARRLRCTGCGARRIQITVAVDSRPAEMRQREGRSKRKAGDCSPAE